MRIRLNFFALSAEFKPARAPLILVSWLIGKSALLGLRIKPTAHSIGCDVFRLLGCLGHFRLCSFCWERHVLLFDYYRLGLERTHGLRALLASLFPQVRTLKIIYTDCRLDHLLTLHIRRRIPVTTGTLRLSLDVCTSSIWLWIQFGNCQFRDEFKHMWSGRG